MGPERVLLMLADEILPGVEPSDPRPLFVAALVGHVLAGLTATVAGAWAASVRKRPGRHPRAGRTYLAALAVVAVTAAIMVLMLRHKWHLLALAVVAAGLAGLGLAARRYRWHGWLAWHGAAMPGSYVAMLTAFYVDNGPGLPGWDRLPAAAFWILPAAVGLPLTVWALVRNHAVRLPQRRRE